MSAIPPPKKNARGTCPMCGLDVPVHADDAGRSWLEAHKPMGQKRDWRKGVRVAGDGWCERSNTRADVSDDGGCA